MIIRDYFEACHTCSGEQSALAVSMSFGIGCQVIVAHIGIVETSAGSDIEATSYSDGINLIDSIG